MKLIIVPICLLITISAIAENRAWTDATTSRTLNGEFVKVDGTGVVIRLANGKDITVAINRLTAADKDFIKARMAAPTEAPASGDGPLTKIAPPVSVKPRPVKGKGDSREAGLEITNNSDKAISRLVVKILLFGADGSLKKAIPHTSDGYFGNGGKTLRKGKSFVKEMNDFWIKDDITAVAGIPKGVTWEDGTTWPTWTGPTPEQKDNAPASIVMKGVLGEGDFATPVIECFNHSSKRIKTIQFRIIYLGKDGNKLDTTSGGISYADENAIEPGKGIAIASGDGPPEGTVEVKLNLSRVIFGDGSKWASRK